MCVCEGKKAVREKRDLKQVAISRRLQRPHAAEVLAASNQAPNGEKKNDLVAGLQALRLLGL